MIRICLKLILIGAILFYYGGCAARITAKNSSPPLSLEKVNWQIISEQQEGLEVHWEDAKDLRDFYRGGVQQKGEAEKKFQAGAYSEAMKLYNDSNEFFSIVLNHIDQDSAEFFLFEGSQILFFPNLLMGDNYYKMGHIHKKMDRQRSAYRYWKRALKSVRRSLQAEPTQWGLVLEEELNSLLASK